MGQGLTSSELKDGRQCASSRRRVEIEAVASVSPQSAPGGQGRQLPEGSWPTAPSRRDSTQAKGASRENTMPASHRHPPVAGSGALPGGHVPQWSHPGMEFSPAEHRTHRSPSGLSICPTPQNSHSAEPLGATPPGGQGAQTGGADAERLWAMSQAWQAYRRPSSSRRISSPGRHVEQLDEPRGAYLKGEE